MAKSISVKKTATSAKKTAVKADVAATAKKSVKPTKNKETITPKMIFDIWLSGWKNMFKLQGRSSRLELWVFLLINSVLTSLIHLGCYYIASPNYLRSAYANGYGIEDIEMHIASANIVFYLVMIITVVPLISLLIRRLHDVGHLAWKKYLEPASMSMVSMWIMFLASLYIEEMRYNEGITELLAIIALALYTCFIISLYATGYYCLKFLITTLFYTGMEEANPYGKAVVYNTPYYENIALSLSCIYLLFISTTSLLYLIIFIM